MNDRLKKAWRYLHSMQFAIVLLLLVCAACVVGSLLPQGKVAAYYTQMLGEAPAAFALALQLDEIFTAPWFIVLTSLLCLNLLLCSITRFSAVLKKYKTQYTLENRYGKQNYDIALVETAFSATELLQKCGFRRTVEKEIDGAKVLYACKAKAGVWGAWVTHVGMLMVIVGFAVGQMLAYESVVYGVPGVSQKVEGKPYTIAIDSFDVVLRDDYTVEQYISGLTITKDNGESVSGTSMVNHPFDVFGMRLYQNSTGWASDVAVYHGEELVEAKVLYVGETIGLTEYPITLVFHALYPDYYNDGNGPRSLTPELRNPAVLFSIYYEEKQVDMNVAGIGYDISVGDYRFVFENPRQYTLIQVAEDPTMGFVLIGGIVLLFGLFLSFYVRTEEAWTVREGESCVLYARSEKGTALFVEHMSETVQELGGKVVPFVAKASVKESAECNAEKAETTEKTATQSVESPEPNTEPQETPDRAEQENEHV